MTQEFVTLRREAVEQALEALNASMPHNNDMGEDWPSHIAARRALRAALEQPQGEQKPRAWLHIDRLGWEQAFTNEPPPSLKAKCQPLYTHSQNLNCKSNQARLATLWGYVKEQSKREPLANQQIDAIAESMPGGLDGFLKGWGWRQFSRAIEAAHNIK